MRCIVGAHLAKSGTLTRRLLDGAASTKLMRARSAPTASREPTLIVGLLA
jgi:hypothetical protein